jgi:hypothetical protein
MQHVSFDAGRAFGKYPKILVVLDGPAALVNWPPCEATHFLFFAALALLALACLTFAAYCFAF